MFALNDLPFYRCTCVSASRWRSTPCSAQPHIKMVSYLSHPMLDKAHSDLEPYHSNLLCRIGLKLADSMVSNICRSHVCPCPIERPSRTDTYIVHHLPASPTLLSLDIATSQLAYLLHLPLNEISCPSQNTTRLASRTHPLPGAPYLLAITEG